jgi:TetR/AcrR family transcriptional repressor of nem operon
MGHSKAEKADSHERIVRIAAARLRELGADAIAVADLMQEAGLTHGGFYRHFASRGDLIDESIERALSDGANGAFAAEASGKLARRALLLAVIDWYLSPQHRDGLATSCAVTSLAADVARGSARARAAYTRQVAAYLELFVRLMEGDAPAGTKRAEAIALWAGMVGALSMARAVNDERLSHEILKTAADDLKGRLA